MPMETTIVLYSKKHNLIIGKEKLAMGGEKDFKNNLGWKTKNEVNFEDQYSFCLTRN